MHIRPKGPLLCGRLSLVILGGKGSYATGAVSSVGLERLVYTQEVTGSNPVPPTGREVKGSSRGVIMAFREAARLLIAEPSEEARQGPRSSAEAPASPSAKRPVR